MKQDRFSRLNKYRTMWLMTSFDLPTNTKYERKVAAAFRKMLLQSGFIMFQYSMYVRFCSSRENADVHKNRIEKALPKEGNIAIIPITDKQFGNIDLYQGKKQIEPEKPGEQLHLF